MFMFTRKPLQEKFLFKENFTFLSIVVDRAKVEVHTQIKKHKLSQNLEYKLVNVFSAPMMLIHSKIKCQAMKRRRAIRSKNIYKFVRAS